MHVANATYGRGGSRANPAEAEAALEVLERELASRDVEVGVTALSTAQAAEIQARLEKHAEESELLREWLDEGNRVKNLETIQGDECDVMILSFGYGKDEAGVVQANFGPLSREDGYRRLNVAITRARRKTVVVASIRAADIPATVGAGGLYVRQYLDYAERGPVALPEALTASVQTYESGFEEDVATRLRALGWGVRTQVGVSRYRIDLGVLMPGEPGRFLAGIECDGATYHSAQTARDRDLARQEVLRRLGWELYRVWSPDWFREREKVVMTVDGWLRERLASVRSGNKAQPPIATGAILSDEPEEKPADEEVFVRSSSPPIGLVAFDSPFIASYYPRKDWIADLLKSGPLHDVELRRAVRDGLGYGRTGWRVDIEIDACIEEAVDSGLVVRDRAWYWLREMDRRRVALRARGPEQRRFEYYTDEELLRAMQVACRDSRMAASAVPEAVLRLLGFGRTNNTAKHRIETLLPRAMSEGVLRASGDGWVTGEAD